MTTFFQTILHEIEANTPFLPFSQPDLFPLFLSTPVSQLLGKDLPEVFLRTIIHLQSADPSILHKKKTFPLPKGKKLDWWISPCFHLIHLELPEPTFLTTLYHLTLKNFPHASKEELYQKTIDLILQQIQSVLQWSLPGNSEPLPQEILLLILGGNKAITLDSMAAMEIPEIFIVATPSSTSQDTTSMNQKVVTELQEKLETAISALTSKTFFPTQPTISALFTDYIYDEVPTSSKKLDSYLAVLPTAPPLHRLDPFKSPTDSSVQPILWSLDPMKTILSLRGIEVLTTFASQKSNSPSQNPFLSPSPLLLLSDYFKPEFALYAELFPVLLEVHLVSKKLAPNPQRLLDLVILCEICIETATDKEIMGPLQAQQFWHNFQQELPEPGFNQLKGLTDFARQRFTAASPMLCQFKILLNRILEIFNFSSQNHPPSLPFAIFLRFLKTLNSDTDQPLEKTDLIHSGIALLQGWNSSSLAQLMRCALVLKDYLTQQKDENAPSEGLIINSSPQFPFPTIKAIILWLQISAYLSPIEKNSDGFFEYPRWRSVEEAFPGGDFSSLQEINDTCYQLISLLSSLSLRGTPMM